MDLLIKELALHEQCVVLLQAGSITSVAAAEYGTITALEAYEKIARHWSRLGFSVWSDTDDDWLCLLSEERLKIESVVPELLSHKLG